MNLNGFHITYRLGVLILVFLSYSCSKESYNVVWNGVILDSETHQPVPFTSIQTKALFQSNIDQSKVEEHHLLSDANGQFFCRFEKAYRVNILVEPTRHQTFNESYFISKSKLPDTIYLHRSDNSIDLQMSLNEKGFHSNAPFISQQMIYTSGKRKYGTSTQKKGFDFLNQQSNLSQFDIGLNIKKQQNNYEIELFATQEGGIFPVYSNQISESFFLEIENAPLHGYQKNYRINGNEAGYFLKCRDGKHFAKVVFKPELYKLNITSRQDSIVEMGLKFNYILQNDSTSYSYFPVIDILEQINEQQLTSILDTIPISNQ
ncbi:hypothetical protein [Carboxylicivirga linearis]|uniref:Uncharacterized protein n=1 Tax=Carboxylicivirga linearis TaxID=1628157 RepID=A0ABS5JT06_9BACT|nr:hypothetical protein [Carboxylicivirga linearis]MBS2098008.1 hypothetical protein [Carboxylicivirga linearis]